MVIDLEKFVTAERPYWVELESMLVKLEADAGVRLELRQLQRLHYLYERTSADLGKLVTFASEPETRRYLENLVARAYGEIHETREKPHRLAPLDWFFQTFPQTFRRHAGAFWLSVAITMVGVFFGLGAVAFDSEAKGILLPFGHGEMDPAKRVAQEEKDGGKHLEGNKGKFSAHLIQNNTKVSITAMALGMTWGLGTIVLLFYNGIILGGVVVDYVLAGQTKFLLAWLLPHGSVEIPAILIAGQAGLVLGSALIGRGSRLALRARMRATGPDLVTLIFGVAVMLLWAGFVEAFLSQYHGPSLYPGKIAFGTVELVLLAVFLARSGMEKRSSESAQAHPTQNTKLETRSVSP